MALDLLIFKLIFLGNNSTTTESTDTSNENSKSTGTSGSDESSSNSNETDDNGSDDPKTTQKTSDNAKNSDGKDVITTAGSSKTVIVVVVVIILLLIGAGVGYWFVKGKQGGAGKAGSSPEPVQNQKYDQVPAQDIEAK